MRFFQLPIVLLLAGCASSEPLTTTNARCGQSEAALEVATVDMSRDVLLIVDPDLARDLEPQLRQLVEGIVTGRADEDPSHRLIREDEVRVAVLSPADAAAWLSRLSVHEIAYARYRHAPYGYGDDVAAFVDRALCPVDGDRGCGSDGPTPSDQHAFGTVFTDIFVVSDRDACRPGEQASGGTVGCDPALTALINAYETDTGYGSLSLIVGVPSDLATLEAYRHYEDRWPTDLLADPRMHAARDGDICAGTAFRPVQAAPALIEQMADRYTAIVSLCSGDFRNVLTMWECGHADYASPTWVDRIARDAAGGYACEWRETLPVEGLITRCAQLDAFGRAAEPIAIEDGREVCLLDQIAEADVDTEYGWFIPTEYRFRQYWQNDPEIDPTPGCALYRSVMPGMPAPSWPTELIARSKIELRCRLTTSAASCE